ncbi:MAG TPA: helix-turn-helix transcriptional regulator [Nakamurella sp.]
MIAGSPEDTVLRAIMDLIDRAARADSGPIIPWSVLDDLAHLIPAESVSVADLDIAGESRVIQQALIEQRGRCTFRGDEEEPDGALFWRHYKSWWAGGPPSRAGEVRRWTDRYPGRELNRQPLVRDYFRTGGITHGLTLGFPTAAEHELNLLFFRMGGPDFTDRDKDLLRLLRPHLAEILAAHSRRQMRGLTPREWQVLDLADGHSNADIAAILFTSVGTVRKHMEHIFDRAGVRNRNAAVARLMPAQVRIAGGRAGIGTGSRPAQRRA